MKQNISLLLNEAGNNPNILAVFLTGSRGKGFEHEKSDFDAYIITKDEASEIDKEKLRAYKSPEMDLCIFTFSEFKKYASWDSKEAWDRYDFVQTKILMDKTNELSSIIKDKGYIPKEKKNDFIIQILDAYINSVYRSVKCKSNKNIFGSRLEAALSIPYLLDLVFAFEDRPKPFYGYLEKELSLYPLMKLPWSRTDFLNIVLKIIETGDVKLQQNVLKEIEKTFRRVGFGKTFDAWEGKDKWAMNYCERSSEIS